MKPFNRERFLLYLLGAIFAYQAGVFAFGLWSCSQVTPTQAIRDVCPEIGTRYDQTFSVMIATTLALLTGGAVVGVNQRTRPSDGDKDAKP